MTPVPPRRERRDPPEWVRDYVPLSTLIVAMLIALFVLPSTTAMTRPDLNPQPEYTPVPPRPDDELPPPGGALQELGLGASGTTKVKGGPGGPGTPPQPDARVPRGRGVSPSNKRCVGVPPRQTEDPTSPPCVGYFAGDNFGATSRGVTGNEVRVLVYMDSKYTDVGTSRGQEKRPEQHYVDLFAPPDDGEHVTVRALRGWQRYFNERFQTYGRAIRFIVHFGSSDTAPEHRTADAADGLAYVRPFAVISEAHENEASYVEAMARAGVLNFGTFGGRSETFFQRYPRYIWGYYPTVEYQARTFSSYVCRKVVGHPTALSGNIGENGLPRKLGLWHTDDEGWPALQLLAQMVAKQVEACGGAIDATATFPRCCIHEDFGTNPDYASAAMAEFQQRGITTILWPGGVEGNVAKAATSRGYFPEWILLGDGTTDTNGTPWGAGQATSFDHRALIVTPTVVKPARAQQHCGQGIREADRDYPAADLFWACRFYENLFQLFVGIQVAGPRLSPASIDRGFHAIPARRSSSPHAPACFYDPGDYTCVKDAQVELWSSRLKTEDRPNPGCWTLIQGGRRYQPGEWPAGNVDAQGLPADRCNQF